MRPVDCGEVTLAVREWGPVDGPLVVLLHGFPETSRAFDVIGPLLAAAGLRVLAPDQRGYGASERPVDVASYRLERLVDDVVGLVRAAGREHAAIVGHDWGAAVAWTLALLRPEVVTRLAVLNVPHPAVMQRALRRDPRQMLRSWYMLLFQLPWLPERLLTLGRGAFTARMLARTARPGAFAAERMAAYRAAWTRPGAMTAMLAWYRAIVRHPPRLSRVEVAAETLVLWGEHDVALRPGLAEASLAHCPRGRLVRFPDCTHWLHLEQPARVAALLRDFLVGGEHRAPDVVA
ncbi:MAG: alpha/beta fold hydrolase [Planctomycetes bacterium]|nr:alpha/beta fold hydrolase [Planctomycetota bacterium]